MSGGSINEPDEEYWAALVPELIVTNLEHSLAFYLDGCGFSLRFARPEDRFAYIEFGKAQLMLEEVSDEAWVTGRLDRPFGRGINLQIEVPDAVSLHDRLLAVRAHIFDPIKTEWYREGDLEHGQKQFLVEDPDGYLLRFIQVLGQRPLDPSNSG